jgi:hypothetical protein
MTVSVVCWLKLPEVAVTIAVYVPAGVPFAPPVVVLDEPPQPTHVRRAKTITGAAKPVRRRFVAKSNPEAPNARVHQMTPVPIGKLPDGPPLAVPEAVVATDTATEVGELPVTLTDAGTLQVAAGVAAGVTVQVRFTVPLNDPDGESVRANAAVCPAEMVCELDPPDAVPHVKPGVAVPIPVRLTICGELIALSVI